MFLPGAILRSIRFYFTLFFKVSRFLKGRCLDFEKCIHFVKQIHLFECKTIHSVSVFYVIHFECIQFIL